jgi:hypothetical protein
MGNTFAIKEVLDYTVESYNASGRGDILFYTNYAGNSNVETTAERLSIRGGQGNYKIIDLDHTKDTMFNSTLPIVDIEALAVKLGKSVSTGAKAVNMERIFTVGGTPEITLPFTPLAGTLKIYKVANERDIDTEQTVGTPGTTVNEYSISGDEITLNATTAASGTKFLVSFDYTSGANAKNVKITANDFPAFITIRGRGIVDDDQVGQKMPVSFIIHKAKVKPDFSLTMESTTATELEFNCDCYTILNSDGDREYIDMTLLGDEAY